MWKLLGRRNMSSYKLIYFDAKARGETARLLFAAAGQEYEDCRIDEFKEWGPELKKTFPFEQVPVLDVDGKRLAQSGAINRYLARRLNLYGDNDFEAAQIDQVCEVLVDLGVDIRKCVKEEDRQLRERLTKDFLETGAKKYYRFLANLLDQNGGDGFFVGKRLSLADLDVLTNMKDMIPRVPGLTITEPKLVAHVERIQAIPEIAEWLKKRPDTEI